MAKAIRWTPERLAEYQKTAHTAWGTRIYPSAGAGQAKSGPVGAKQAPGGISVARRARTPEKRPPALPAVLIKGLPPCVAEFRFAAPRKWRADYAWPSRGVILEVEGGAWTQGRHTRGGGFLSDMLKYNEMACLGWRLIRCTPDQLKSGEILPTVLRALA